MSIEGKVVCVTGASGYIASWLVKLLLNRGYIVHATIMSLDDPKQTQHLLALDGAKERLSLFEANLTAEGSFDCAVNGCVCVFHTASPVTFAPVDDPQMELLDPAVKGTLNVLKSAAKVKSLKRVVLTSSLAAVLFCDKVRSGVVDETWFSDPVICEQRKVVYVSFGRVVEAFAFWGEDSGMCRLGLIWCNSGLELWYQLSKTLAENAAVKFSKENGLDLVVINPGFVIGPLLQPSLNFTSEAFMRFIETGKEVYVDGIYMLVDVRDVATAHILAFEKAEANGRYCIVADVVWSSDIKMILYKLYPDLGYSIGYKDKCAETQLYSVSKAKAESLGVEFTPLEVSVKDTVESLKEKKFMNI